MTDLRKAAEMALERLESHEYWMDEEAIQTLRKSLAQPEWVGLTDEEIHNTEDYFESRTLYRFARAIEAKLKEKNT